MAMTYAVTAIPGGRGAARGGAAVPARARHVRGRDEQGRYGLGGFEDADLAYRPHARRSLDDMLKHQLLSERRFFGEFLGSAEPAAGEVRRIQRRRCPRASASWRWRVQVSPISGTRAAWWTIAFVLRCRAGARMDLWRRVLHTAHHRTQLTVYLRMLDGRAAGLRTHGGRDVGRRGSDDQCRGGGAEVKLLLDFTGPGSYAEGR